MEKTRVLIFVESRYKVNRKRIKSKIENVLRGNQIETPIEVSIAVVGDRKMRQLSKKYTGEEKTRNVLSFSLTEGETVASHNDILRLGDIVVSYPEVIREASKDEVLVDDKVDELIEHGLLHLLGLHHE